MGPQYSLSIDFTVQYTHCYYVLLKRQVIKLQHYISITMMTIGIFVNMDGEIKN